MLSTFFAREAFYHIVFWNFDLASGQVCMFGNDDDDYDDDDNDVQNQLLSPSKVNTAERPG